MEKSNRNRNRNRNKNTKRKKKRKKNRNGKGNKNRNRNRNFTENPFTDSSKDTAWNFSRRYPGISNVFARVSNIFSIIP